MEDVKKKNKWKTKKKTMEKVEDPEVKENGERENNDRY